MSQISPRNAVAVQFTLNRASCFVCFLVFVQLSSPK